MADILLTVETGGGGDYALLSSCHADWDDTGIFSSGDNLTVEMHDNGDIVETAAVVINAGGTVGLNDIVITPASGDEHDGTAGSGVVLDMGGEFSMNYGNPSGIGSIKCEGIEFDFGNAGGLTITSMIAVGSRWEPSCLARCIAHNCVSGNRTSMMTYASGSAYNNIFYDFHYGSNTYNAIMVDYTGYGGNFANNTLHNVGIDDANSYTINLTLLESAGAGDMINNLCFLAMGTSGTIKTCSNAAITYHHTNYTDLTDGTATTSATDTDYFVSTTPGSVDLKLKSGAPAIDDGSDVASFNFDGDWDDEVDTDIIGRNRDTEGDTWDVGAHEYTSTGTTVEPTGVTSDETFGSGTVIPDQNVTPSGITSGEATGTATLTAGSTVNPSALASEETFGTQQLNHTLPITGIASDETLPNPTLTGASTVTPTGIASEESVPATATITTSSLVQPSGIASTEVFGTTTITSDSVVSPTGIVSDESFGTTSLSSAGVVAVPSLVSEEAFGSLSVGHVLLLSGIGSAEIFGSPTVDLGLTVQPVGISSEISFGTAKLNHTIQVICINSGEIFGNHFVSNGIVGGFLLGEIHHRRMSGTIKHAGGTLLGTIRRSNR